MAKGNLRIFRNYNMSKEGEMKVVINVESSQLREVLRELGGSFSDMDVVINIKEEESKEEESRDPNYESLTTEDLQRIQEKQKEIERKEEYSP
jgi:hypothetical protein